MGKHMIARRGLTRAAVAVALAGLVAGCAGDQAGPAPVYLKNGMAEGAPVSFPAPRRETQRVVVRPGQSLKGIARTYRVPERTIIAANHLAPPYKLKIGASLVIPGAAADPGHHLPRRPAACAARDCLSGSAAELTISPSAGAASGTERRRAAARRGGTAGDRDAWRPVLLAGARPGSGRLWHDGGRRPQ